MLSVWLPISGWDDVCAWPILEALHHAARSLLRPYEASEILLARSCVSPSRACIHLRAR